MTSPFTLIIEDDPDLSDIFSQALQAAGYTTEVIQDGLVAQKRIKELSDVYLVILDLHLPNVSGEVLLKQMKENANYEKTRVIVTTADTVTAELLREKADVVLVKPISYAQLRDLAQRFLPR